MAEWIGTCFISAVVLRLVLLVYGEWQDQTMSVKYTDIDYHVFSDAAAFVARGRSPYERSTYRYTPLLAWLLVPNVFLHPMWGKLVFVLGDVISGWVLVKMLTGVPGKWKLLALWLFNPLTLTISTRGSAESIMACLVLSTLYFLRTERVFLAGVMYGLAVHFKIYPIVYSLAIYFSLSDNKNKHNVFSLFWPNRRKIVFTVTTLLVLVGSTFIGYYFYGYQFLDETYLYHVKRKDTRHNFSLYFYLLYLKTDLPGFVFFLPQVVLVVLTSFKLYQPWNLPFCLFTQTFVFVTLNKVITSQYFVWYITFLPLILPRMKMTRRRVCTLLLVYSLPQGFWLLFAYCLEFLGLNVFLLLWFASVVVFAANVFVFGQIAKHYDAM